MNWSIIKASQYNLRYINLFRLRAYCRSWGHIREEEKTNFMYYTCTSHLFSFINNSLYLTKIHDNMYIALLHLDSPDML